MGLDFTISLKFKNVDTLDVKEVDIAYFRSFFTLRTEVIYLAKNTPQYFISGDNDHMTMKIDFLPILIKALCTEIADRQSDWFSGSNWGGACGRQIAIRELETLCLWDTVYSRLDDIREANDYDYRESFTYILSELGDIIEDIENLPDYKKSGISIIRVLEKLEDYEITLEIDNSY